jgi:hypothetical protein
MHRQPTIGMDGMPFPTQSSSKKIPSFEIDIMCSCSRRGIWKYNRKETTRYCLF